MGTLTTQILVGSPHPYHGGINPTHYLFLSENDRPAWILVNQNVFPTRQRGYPKIIWIPTVENMLEDALLMIAIHVCKNREVVELAQSFSDKIQANRVEMYRDFEESQRKQLYQKCKVITDFPKIIISTFRDSSIEMQLSVLKQYRMDVEVCRVSYSRLYSPWEEDTLIEGSL